MKVEEILEKRAQLKVEGINILDKCKEELRKMTDEETTRFNEIKDELKKLDEEMRSCEEENKEPKKEEKSETENPDNEEEKEEKENEEADAEPEANEEKEEKNNRNFTMEKRFSILTAIRSIANNKPMDELTQAVLDKGNEEMRKAGLNYVGQIQLPFESRALTVAAEGEDIVATDLMDIVKPLQAKNVMAQAGAKFITGLVGDIQYPVMSKGSCTWEGETAQAKDGSMTFSNVKLSPKRLTTVVPISKQFLIQDSVGAENAIREEIINAINAKLEATILGSGEGSSTEPAGMFNGTLDSVATFADICNLEAGLETANVYGELKYIVAPKAKAALRGMAKSSKSTQLVWENGEIDGTPALSTSHVADKNIVYGDFSQYIIAQWGNLDITVDNVTLADKGQIRLVVNAYFDMKALRPEAFKVATIA